MKCTWTLAEGRRATYLTSCGKVIMASDPPERGGECPDCDGEIKLTPSR